MGLLPPETLLVFCTTAVLLALTPVPDNSFVLLQSLSFGPRAGWLVTLGLCTGVLVHTTAVALGVAAVFQASATAFHALKIICAGYLLYLAWQAWRAASAAATLHADGEAPAAPPASWLYRRGMFMSISNPKVAVFFLAFLPQFAVPERGHLTAQIFLLGGLFMVSALVVFSSIAWGLA